MPDELLQVSQSAINSLMRERDQANENARNAATTRDEYDRRHAQDQAAIAQLDERLQQAMAQIADLEKKLIDGAWWQGVQRLNTQSNRVVLHREEYDRLQRISERAYGWWKRLQDMNEEMEDDNLFR